MLGWRWFALTSVFLAGLAAALVHSEMSDGDSFGRALLQSVGVVVASLALAGLLIAGTYWAARGDRREDGK